MSENYDLVVIGAGSGGVRAARMAAVYGAKVALIEESRVGGTCVIRGCVPKKLLVFASRFAELFDVAQSFGWQVMSQFDWTALLANKDREIDRLEDAYVGNLEGSGVTLFRDRGTIAGPNAVHLRDAGTTLAASHILIATGGHPFWPNITGAGLGMTSNEALDLPELPRSVLIEGAGYIAVEFAGIFAGLGVKTTISYRRDRILRGFDEDLRTDLEAILTARGVRILYNRSVARLEKATDGVRAQFSDGEAHSYGAVMFATGRVPNIAGLGLEGAGVELSLSGNIAVDEYGRTSVPSIYAVGDVTGGAQLTPVAIRQGAAFAETIFNNNPVTVDLSLVPTAIFSDPEMGTIGLTEAEAVKKHKDIEVYITRFRPMINNLSARPERMMLKLITSPNGGRVLGCHLLGPGAAEMIQLIAIPLGMGATKADFNRAIAVHPTAAEELVTFKAPSYHYENGVRAG